MIRLLAVIQRDLTRFRRNPVVIAMSVLMPLIYLVILGNSFQGKLTGLPVAVADLDGGPEARRLLDKLRAVEAGPRTIAIVAVPDEGAAVGGVKAGRYKGAVVIPRDYSRRTALRSDPQVGLFLDNPDAISAETVRGLLLASLQSARVEYVPIRDVPGVPILREVNLFPKVDYYQSLVPGVIIMSIFLGTLTTGVFNLVMDRFLGIQESYLLTPLTKAHIVGGLVASGLSITTVIATVITVASMLVTGIPLADAFRSAGAILAVIVLTTLCLLGLMFVLIGRAGHPRIVGIVSGFLNVILFFPSGAVYPTASFPGWLRAFARVNPEAYAVDALKSILFRGAGLSAVSGDLLFLAAFTAVTMSVAIATFKRTI